MGKYIPVTLNNITALEFQSSLPQGKVALVCEGGGQRGSLPRVFLMNLCAHNLIPSIFYLGCLRGAKFICFCLRPAWLCA